MGRVGYNILLCCSLINKLIKGSRGWRRARFLMMICQCPSAPSPSPRRLTLKLTLTLTASPGILPPLINNNKSLRNMLLNKLKSRPAPCLCPSAGRTARSPGMTSEGSGRREVCERPSLPTPTTISHPHTWPTLPSTRSTPTTPTPLMAMPTSTKCLTPPIPIMRPTVSPLRSMWRTSIVPMSKGRRQATGVSRCPYRPTNRRIRAIGQTISTPLGPSTTRPSTWATQCPARQGTPPTTPASTPTTSSISHPSRRPTSRAST